MAVEQFFEAETVWHCEFDHEPSKVLAARWPGVPNLGDVTTVDWSAVEPVDIMCGGFPCQDLSLAGRRSGMRPGTRSGLWADFRTAIAAIRPKVVVIENVRGLLSGCAESDSEVEPCPGCLGISKQHRPLVRALGRVLGDLASLGFDAEWGSLEASAVGAPHGRFRVFVVAYARGVRFDSWGVAGPGETPGGWSSAVGSGRGGEPLTLLPTPAASNPNDEEDLDKWLDRRARVKESAGNGNGFGVPLGVAVRLLPIPIVSDGSGGSKNLEESEFAPQLRDIGKLLPTPRAARGASSTETMYALGATLDDNGDAQGNVTGEVSWGKYEAGVRRWEALTRPVPPPTRPDGKDGRPRLNPLLPEWLMGYTEGWVTDIVDRNAAIKACGNGVVPQQAYAAVSELWARILDSLVVAS